MLSALQAAPILMFPSVGLLAAALDIAIRLEHPVYDCLYLALAREQGVSLITADRRLLNAARKDPVFANLVEPLA